MRFEIVTDTSSNLTDSTIDEFGLYILPLSFMVDGVQHQSYLKGEKSDLQRFYTMMRKGRSSRPRCRTSPIPKSFYAACSNRVATFYTSGSLRVCRVPTKRSTCS